jgi:SAM-dependent methyltransferase
MLIHYVKEDINNPDPKYSQMYDILGADSLESVTKWLKLIDTYSLTSILDVGAGTGAVAIHLTKEQTLLDCIDGDYFMVEKLKKLKNTKINPILGDVFNFNFEKKYDLILVSSLFINLFNSKQRFNLLKILSETLKNEGIISIEMACPSYFNNTLKVHTNQNQIIKPISFENDIWKGNYLYLIGSEGYSFDVSLHIFNCEELLDVCTNFNLVLLDNISNRFFNSLIINLKKC